MSRTVVLPFAWEQPESLKIRSCLSLCDPGSSVARVRERRAMEIRRFEFSRGE